MTFSPTFALIAGAVVVLAAVIAVVVLRSRTSVDEPPQNPYIEGLKRLIEGDRGRAFDEFQRAVKAGFAPTDAYIRVGRMLRHNGDASKALQIHKSLTVKPDLTRGEKLEVYVEIAKDYTSLEKPELAVGALESALRLNIKEPVIYELLAAACHTLGRTETAYNFLREMKKSGTIGDRELALYLATVGAEEMVTEREREARKTLGRALKHDAGCGPAHLALGDLDEASDQVDAAIGHWRDAARASEALAPPAFSRLERVLFQRGTFSEIESVYQDIRSARPNNEHATLALAAFYRKQGRTDDAVSLLEVFTSTNRASIGGTLLLTSLYASRGDTVALESFLEGVEEHVSVSGNTACATCGYESDRMRWHCPQCNAFDSFQIDHA